MKTTIHWFRKGLRLHDNPALLKALQCDHFAPVFIIDPHFAGPDKVGLNRYRFLLESLHDLDKGLRERGSRLIILRGKPEEVLKSFAKEIHASQLTFEFDTEPYAKTRDDKVVQELEASGIEAESVVGHTLWDARQIFSLGGDKVPLTFRSFEALVRTLPKPPKPFAAPLHLPPLPHLPSSLSSILYSTLPSLSSLGYSSDLEKEALDLETFHISISSSPSTSEEEVGDGGGEGLSSSSSSSSSSSFSPPSSSSRSSPSGLVGGEREGVARLRAVLEREDWVRKFSKPDTSPTSLEASTTELSPWLKFGCVGVREMWWGLDKIAKKLTAPPVSLSGQLLWREFYYAHSFATENFHQMVGNPLCRTIAWHKDEEKLMAWKEGRTGYPWIDACMRQLRVTGWIHHLQRHCVACFLTRGDLYLSWEEGEKVFDEYLIDADYALNAGNWMWVSCSAFYHQFHRIYGPVSFPKKTDKKGALVRKWVPELKDFPDKYIYEPWKAPREVQASAGCVIGTDYPERIIIHEEASSACKARMAMAFRIERERKEREGGGGKRRKKGGEEE